MMETQDLKVTLDDITIHAKNFKGRAEKDNAAGTRYIAVVIPDGQEDRFVEEGWKVRHATAKSGKDVPYIRVYFPHGFDVANIKLNGKSISSDDGLTELDSLELLTGTLNIYGRYWEVFAHPRKSENPEPSRKGIKAYLLSLDVITKP
jgi:hypothetical protein